MDRPGARPCEAEALTRKTTYSRCCTRCRRPLVWSDDSDAVFCPEHGRAYAWAILRSDGVVVVPVVPDDPDDGRSYARAVGPGPNRL
jgi:hypothetical protein